jgi:hypothetical protein
VKIETKLRERLYNCGLFPDQISAVIDMMKKDPMNKSMNDRWNDDEEGYPPMVMALAWNAAKIAALEWIKANCPNAWFRPVFDP